MRWLSWLLSLSLSVAAAAQDDSCVLKSPLPVVMRSGGGEVEGTLPPGTEVTISGSGDRVKARTGASVVSTDRGDWLAACSGLLRICTTRQPVQLYAEARSDAATQALPAQTELHVRRQGKLWAEVGALRDTGYVLVKALSTCRSDRREQAAVRDIGAEDGADAGSVEYLERGEGPGVWVIPFSGDGVVPAGTVEGLSSTMWESWARSRPDAAPGEAEPGEGPKQLQAQLAHGRRVGMAYVVIGRVFAAAGGDIVTVEVSVYDTASNKQIRGLRVRPNDRAEWAIDVVRTLWPQLRQAPGQQQPKRPQQVGGFEVAPLPVPGQR